MYSIVFINIFNKKSAVVISSCTTLSGAKRELCDEMKIHFMDLSLYKYTSNRRMILLST